VAPLRRYVITGATVACLLFGLVSALRVVGWSNLSPTGPEAERPPIAFDDHALQFYYGRLGSRFLSEGGVTYGYDPYFMAGYVKSPVYYPSSKPFELSLWLFSESDPGTVFNLTLFCMLAVLPLIMYAAAVNLRLLPAERLAVVAMSVIPHAMVPTAGFYGIMEGAGMAPYIFASFLSVLVVSLVGRFLSSGGSCAGVALWVCAPLLYFTHPTAIVISAIPIAAVYAGMFRRASFLRHAWLWLVLITVLVTNWPWIKGYILFSHYADLSDFYTPEGMQHFVPAGGALAPLRVYVPRPRLLSLVPPVFGIVGLYAWWRAKRMDLLLVTVPQIIFLFVVSFYGVYLGLSALAPARMTLPLALYSFLPAAHGLVASAKRANTWIQRLGAPWRKRAVVLAAAIALLFALRGSDLGKSIWRPYTLPELEKSQGYAQHGMSLVEWLRMNTDSAGRILHEETNRTSHQYYGSHMPALIPLYTGRELANGPAPHALLKHNFLRFVAGTFRGKPLHKVESKELMSYLTLYNVRWVLCWSLYSKRYFNQLPTAVHAGNYDKFTLYRMTIPPSYFLWGSGRVKAQENRIVLRDVAPRSGSVGIKYHWLETLRTDPPRTIEPVPMLDDPVPFISVVDPPRRIVIYNDYDVGLRAWRKW